MDMKGKSYDLDIKHPLSSEFISYGLNIEL